MHPFWSAWTRWMLSDSAINLLMPDSHATLISSLIAIASAMPTSSATSKTWLNASSASPSLSRITPPILVRPSLNIAASLLALNRPLAEGCQTITKEWFPSLWTCNFSLALCNSPTMPIARRIIGDEWDLFDSKIHLFRASKICQDMLRNIFLQSRLAYRWARLPIHSYVFIFSISLTSSLKEEDCHNILASLHWKKACLIVSSCSPHLGQIISRFIPLLHKRARTGRALSINF